ncbi:S1 RNA-binding domain-containing protein [Candidatus Woesebacteria bacterium]|nr:S1 RNA-binding domain-containing protein [Candidatus Woesebacteria bacterium]
MPKAKAVVKTKKSEKVEEKVVKKVAKKVEVTATVPTPEVKSEPEVKVEKKAPKVEKTVEKKGSAITMEDLLSSAGYTLSVPKKGETMTGLVTMVNRKMVLVDVGAKTEGVVADKEYEIAKEFIETIKPGDEIDVYVASDENERGQILLSLRRAMMGKLWDMLDDYLKNETEVQVKSVELNRGGMIVKWQGLRGFIPSSQFGSAFAGNLQGLVGKAIAVKPIEVDREKNRLIFSEKHVSEAAVMAERETALKAVKVGDQLEGKVTGVLNFGAFVAIHVGSVTVEGLVHISEISWEKVDDIHKYLKVGDSAQVKVMGVEEGTGKLNLSIKQLKNDPWSTAGDKYPAGTTVKGKVSRSAPFGTFVNFEPGVDGLIHVSRMGSFPELTAGEEIEVLVENVDPANRRMSLGPVLTEVPVGYK